jgi:hypothetical protein
MPYGEGSADEMQCDVIRQNVEAAMRRAQQEKRQKPCPDCGRDCDQLLDAMRASRQPKQLHIVAITSYAGKDTSRVQEGGETQDYNDRLGDYPGDVLYAVITVSGGRAEIVDDGYRSYEEAQKAWPEADQVQR